MLNNIIWMEWFIFWWCYFSKLSFCNIIIQICWIIILQPIILWFHWYLHIKPFHIACWETKNDCYCLQKIFSQVYVLRWIIVTNEYKYILSIDLYQFAEFWKCNMFHDNLIFYFVVSHYWCIDNQFVTFSLTVLLSAVLLD